MPEAQVPAGWSLRTVGVRSETALRLINSDQPWARQIVSDIDEWVARYPSQVKDGASVRRRLLDARDHTFRGAAWELFWFAALRGVDQDLAVEHSDHDQDGSGSQPPSVDFMLRTLDIAVEATSVNELNADVRASYWETDIMDAVQRHVFAPGFALHIWIRQAGEGEPDLASVAASVQSWFYEVATGREVGASRLRLDLGWQGWIIDFEARVVEGAQRTIVMMTPSSVKSDYREQVRAILAEKRAKKAAVPRRPLMLAVAMPGRLLGSDRWDRLNILGGDDVVDLMSDGSTRRRRAENGFLLGAGAWRNSEVSAIAFTCDHLPRFGESAIEIWVNGGAGHPMQLEPFFGTATIVAARGEELMERPPGLDSDWVPARVE